MGGRGTGVGWVVEKAKTKKQDDTNSMYPPRANIPLQGLDRRGPTVGVISGPHCHIGASIAAISLVVDLHGRKKVFWKEDQLTLANEYA